MAGETVREVIARTLWRDARQAYDADYDKNDPVWFAAADAILAALSEAGLTVCGVQVGTADVVDKIVSLDESWAPVPPGLQLLHPVFIESEEPK